MTAGAFARVLLDSPLPQLDRLFDYRIPDELRDAVRPGIRVKVPLRSAGRVSEAYVVELADSVSFTGDVNPVEAVISPVPVLTPPTPVTPSTPAAPAGRPVGVAGTAVPRTLPQTGTEALPLLELGLGMVFLGAGAMLFGRERTASI